MQTLLIKNSLTYAHFCTYYSFLAYQQKLPIVKNKIQNKDTWFVIHESNYNFQHFWKFE